MPWFRIVATVAAMEPSLLMPPRIKISAISRRPTAEMEETSAFIAFSVFITYHPALVGLCNYQHLRLKFRVAGNANVTCATACRRGDLEFDLGRGAVDHDEAGVEFFNRPWWR